MLEFNKLSNEVQEKIKSDLGMYDETHVIYENGRFNVSPHLILASSYASDRKFIGSYKATEVFTKEEHIIAQIMTFGYSPTYHINFYPNKDAWSEETKKYAHVREQFLLKEVEHYIQMFGQEPSQEWIDRH